MRKFFLFIGLVAIFGIVGTTSSCKTKEGCGLEEKYGAKIDDDGKMTSKRGKSNLFSKKQRKKMNRG